MGRRSMLPPMTSDFAPVSRSTWMTAPSRSATTRSPSGSMSIAYGSSSGAPEASTLLAPVGLIRSTARAVDHEHRAVERDGDVPRAVERRALGGGRDGAGTRVDAAHHALVGHQQLAGAVEGEPGGVAHLGDLRDAAVGELDPQHGVAVAVGHVGDPAGRERDPDRVVELAAARDGGAAPAGVILKIYSAPSSASSIAPSGATATAHGLRRGVPETST